MTAKRYKTKPFEIEAVLFDGQNFAELFLFTEGKFRVVDPFVSADEPELDAEVWDYLHATWVGVKAGQFIIKGTKSEFYPCDAEVFHNKYEEVV
jgi:hypothetical protein